MDPDQWRAVLRLSLGPRWTKHFDTISSQLDALNRRAKRGLLWDIGPSLSERRLSDLVRELKRSSLLDDSVRVVCIASDHVLVDVRRLLDESDFNVCGQSRDTLPFSEHFESNRPHNQSEGSIECHQSHSNVVIKTHKFINISKTLSDPLLIERNTDEYVRIANMISCVEAKMRQYLFDIDRSTKGSVEGVNYSSKCLVVDEGRISKNSVTDVDRSAKSLVLDIEEDWCVPTLFGYLIGYPVVYWYDVTYNELCREPLVVYKVYVDMRNTTQRNTPQLGATQLKLNTKQRNTTQCDTAQRNTTQCKATRRCATQLYATQRDTTLHSAVQCDATQRNTTQLRRFELYSFSVPKSLVRSVDPCVRSWYEDVERGGGAQGLTVGPLDVEEVITNGIVL